MIFNISYITMLIGFGGLWLMTKTMKMPISEDDKFAKRLFVVLISLASLGGISTGICMMNF